MSKKEALKDEIKKEIETISHIYIFAKETYQYCRYLHLPDTKEEKEYVKVDRHLKNIAHCLWRVFIVEIAKLFSDNENTHKFCLPHFISKLKKGNYYQLLNIPEDKVEEWESILEEKADLIDRIFRLRNSIYAHSDKKYLQPYGNEKNDKDFDIYFKEIDDLLPLVESIIKEIYSTVFDASFLMETVTFDRQKFDIVRILAKVHNDEIDATFGEYLKHSKR